RGNDCHKTGDQAEDGRSRAGVSSLTPQLSSLPHPHRDTLSVRPLEQRDEILAADAEPVSDIGRNDGSVAAELLQGAGKALQRLARVVSIPLNGLDVTPGRCQAKRRRDIGPAGQPG